MARLDRIRNEHRRKGVLIGMNMSEEIATPDE